jgi:hypothetical protein
MCFAILKVTYKSSASNSFIEVEREEDLEARLEEVKGRAEVTSIKRYHLYKAYTLVPTWQESGEVS